MRELQKKVRDFLQTPQLSVARVGASLYLKKFSDLKELGPEILKVGVKRIESLPGLAAGARSILKETCALRRAASCI